ncbi:NTP transferase domain-containing protein [soil metagenome]
MSKSARIDSAIILAAGRGSRLSEHGETHAKAMIELVGETIIQYQIRALHAAGISRIVVVTGFKAAELKAHLPEGVETINNKDFATTNSLYSLMLAKDVLRDGSLVLNSDVIFHFDLLMKLLNSAAPSGILVDYERALADEEMKVVVARNVVKQISKALVPAPGMGENVGIIKVARRHAEEFIAAAQDQLREGVMAWAPAVIDRLVGTVPFHATPVGGLPWTEIDFPVDLSHARLNIYPLCKNTPEKKTPASAKRAQYGAAI